MATITAQEKSVVVNNLRLRYLDWGTAGKPDMVCLHGHTGQAHIWDQFAPAMSPYYHVYALDQRGHGGSQWASDGYDRDRFVEDLEGFIDALGLQRVTLVGLSMGGWHSILYTPHHQDRVERIVIVDIAPEPSQAFRQAVINRPPTPMEFASLDEAVTWARRNNPWVSDQGLRNDMADKMRQQDNGRWTWKADPVLYNRMLPDLVDQWRIDRYWSRLEAITCPILEVRGKESDLVSDEVIHRMASINARLSWVDVLEAGHVVCIDKPQEFIKATQGFLGVPV